MKSQELAASAFSREMNARFTELWPGSNKQNVDVGLFSYLFDTIYDSATYDPQKLDVFIT